MKHLPKVLLFTFLFGLVTFVTAQEHYTVLHKNYNLFASGIEHNLNQTADTLLLQSDKSVLKVSFLSHEKNKTERIDVNSKQVKVPLHYLSEGRYTIAVYREDIIVAFGIERKFKIEVSENVIEDFEEGVLQASLSKEERERRHLKPITKKGNQSTYIANVSEDETSRSNIENEHKNNSLSNRDRLKKEYQSWLEEQRAIVEANQKQSQQEKAAKQKAYQEYLAETRELKTKDEGLTSEEVTKKNVDDKKGINNDEELSVTDSNQSDFETNTRDIESANKRLITELEGKTSKNSTKEETISKIETNKVEYNLSKVNNDESVNRQTREEYRKSHVRPNGKPYDE